MQGMSGKNQRALSGRFSMEHDLSNPKLESTPGSSAQGGSRQDSGDRRKQQAPKAEETFRRGKTASLTLQTTESTRLDIFLEARKGNLILPNKTMCLTKSLSVACLQHHERSSFLDIYWCTDADLSLDTLFM